MMKLTLLKQIHSCFAACSSNDTYLKFDFELPFQPFQGLVLAGENFEETIIEMYWDLKKKKWELYAEEDKRFYDVNNALMDYSQTKEYKDHIQKYLKGGWKIKKLV